MGWKGQKEPSEWKLVGEHEIFSVPAKASTLKQPIIRLKRILIYHRRYFVSVEFNQLAIASITTPETGGGAAGVPAPDALRKLWSTPLRT